MNESYKNQWKEQINKNIKYKKAHYLNASTIIQNNFASQELYVLPCFMKPGKQLYSVLIKDNLIMVDDQQE